MLPTKHHIKEYNSKTRLGRVMVLVHLISSSRSLFCSLRFKPYQFLLYFPFQTRQFKLRELTQKWDYMYVDFWVLVSALLLVVIYFYFKFLVNTSFSFKIMFLVKNQTKRYNWKWGQIELWFLIRAFLVVVIYFQF